MRQASVVLLTILIVSIAAVIPAPAPKDEPYKFGVQTWTLRNFDFDQVIAFAVKHKIRYLQVTAKHIDPAAPAEETKRKNAILDKNGLVCYTFGVNGTTTDKEKNRKLFEFAKLMGIRLISVEPHPASRTGSDGRSGQRSPPGRSPARGNSAGRCPARGNSAGRCSGGLGPHRRVPDNRCNSNLRPTGPTLS